jgi:hypothetical protein
VSTGATAAVTTSSPGDGATRSVRGWRRRRWLLGTGGLLLAAALAVAIALGATYQPVTYGDGTMAVQGAVNVRNVNDFGYVGGQLFIPPQPATQGDLVVSLANTGPYAVTLTSVATPLSYPNALSQSAGSVNYVPLVGPRPQPTTSSPRIFGATLRPGENILIRIPFRTPTCWGSGWSVVNSFWVTTKFLWWTHTFEVHWTAPTDPYAGAIMSQLPDPNGGPGALCPQHQAVHWG